MVQGLMVITAARAARDGASLEEKMDITRRNMKRVDFCAAFDTLEYLRRGGRIGAAQAFLGSMLKTNPIITLRDGVVHPVARERSRAKVIEHLYNFAMRYSHIDGVAIEDAAAPDDAELLAERLSSKVPKDQIYRSKASPVIGTHTGPGLLIISVLGDK